MAKKKKLRLKKTVRRTIASLLMITAIIVAAIPAPQIQAEGDEKLEFRDEKNTYGLDKDIIYYFSIDSGSNAYLQGYTNWDDDSSNYSSKDSITSLTIPSKILLDPYNTGEETEYTVVGINSCANGGKLNSVKFNGNTVTDISAEAFLNSTGLNEIIFPNSLKIIGNSAFQGCTNLSKEIVIPSSVTTIGTDCFNGSGVTSVVFNTTGMETLQSGIFKNTELSSITFNSTGITTISDEAFMGCTNLKSVDLPDGIKTINSRAFYNCTELVDVSFPTSVETMGKQAFAECTKLQNIKGLENTGLLSVSESLFYDDYTLEKVALPTTCTSIGSNAFYQCSGLETVVVPYSITEIPSNCFSYANGLTTFILGNHDGTQNPTSTPEIADYQYAYVGKSSKDTTLGSSFLTPGTKLNVYGFASYDDEETNIYEYCEKNSDITFHDLGDGGSTTYADGIKVDSSSGYVTYVNPLKNTESKLTIPKEVNGVEVKGISTGAFPVGSHYTTIELPETCTYIGDSAFANCEYLTSLVTLADAFSYVGSNALLNGNSELKVTGNISSDNALFNYVMNNPMQDEYGNKIYLPFLNSDYDVKGYTLTVQNESGYPTLVGYQPASNKSELTIPSGVKKINIQYDTFLSNNNNLTTLTIEDNGIEELDNYQFLGDENLTDVTLPNTLTKFGNSDGKPPFTGCINLATIKFSDGAQFACDDYGVITGPDSKGNSNARIYEALEGNPSLSSYSTGSGITEIDKYAFYNNPNLSSIDVGGSTGLTSIPENAFSDCSKLSEIKLGSKITSVEEQAFANAGTPTSKEKANIKVITDNPSIKYNNTPFYGNKKGEREYYFYGTSEKNDASHILADQSDIDGLFWGGNNSEVIDDLNDTDFNVSTGAALEYKGTSFTATLLPKNSADLAEKEFCLTDKNGLIIDTGKYQEKDNGWTITVDATNAKNGYAEFRIYGNGTDYTSSSYVTGKYPIKDSSGGGGGGGSGGSTVSGNIFYVDDLNPDVFEYSASAIEPELTVRLVKNPLTVLTENKDYYVKYENNYYPGVETAKATVQGINAYEGADSQVVTYSIKKNIAECPLEVENGAYTGQLVQPTVHVFDYETEKELVAGTDYVVTRYENNVKKGKNTAKAYVEGIGKYFGDNSGKFSILKTTSSTSKSTSSTSKSSSSSSSSRSSSSSSSSGSSSTNGESTSGNSSPGNQSPGSSGRVVPVDTGDGIGDASGTIEGTTDNYVVKITKTDEADREFDRALSEKYGDISDYRQFAMDISLYDSTGEHKIEDPQGIAVTLTVPIPEELALYGGNNKVAAVDHSGNLENLSTRYSMIDGAPCATFTATHFSPYGFYVDTNNLTAGGLDNTPKTGDPISPKWVIAIGLAALSLFLFLKKDPVPHAAKA